jgi:hypothetical protein
MKRAAQNDIRQQKGTSEVSDEGRLSSTMIELLLADLQLPLAELVWV